MIFQLSSFSTWGYSKIYVTQVSQSYENENDNVYPLYAYMLPYMLSFLYSHPQLVPGGGGGAIPYNDGRAVTNRIKRGVQSVCVGVAVDDQEEPLSSSGAVRVVDFFEGIVAARAARQLGIQ